MAMGFQRQIWFLILIGHLNSSGVWLGVDLKNGHQIDTCLKENELCAQFLLILLGS